MVGFSGALGWERYPFFAEAVFLRLVGGPSFGGDMPTTEKTPCGFCSNTWINRSAAWDGLRVPCSQLCTVFGETFKSRANTFWDIWLLSRMRVTSSARTSGGRSGSSSVVALRMISPLAWRTASSRPFRIWSATASRFGVSFMMSSLSLGSSGLFLQHLDELAVELLVISRDIVLLVLAVDGDEVDLVRRGDMQIDDPGPTSLPLTSLRVGHAQLPQAAAAGNDIPRLGLG